jgi:hypothetical protein
MSNIDIYAILSSKPHNDHYLKRYFNFINACCQSNSSKTKEELGYIEQHHFLPKSLWIEYKSLNKNVWNKAILTARQHFIAHWMLWKTYGGDLTYAFNSMTNWNTREYEKLNFRKSRTYEKLKQDFGDKIGKANSVAHYYNPITFDFIRINKKDTDAIIPEGYIRGSRYASIKIHNEITMEETVLRIPKNIDKSSIKLPDNWKRGHPSHIEVMNGSRIWYDPNTMETQRISKNKTPPENWILGSPNTKSINGKTAYYDPISLDTKWHFKGQQPETFIEGGIS